MATMTRPLSREDGRLDPTKPAVELARQVRAYQPWPGAYLETVVGRLLIWRAEDIADAIGEDSGYPVGTLVADGAGLAIATPAGRLRLLEVQPAGKGRMDGTALRRGRPRLVGSVVDRGPGLRR